MVIIGALLFVFGFVDFFGSFFGFDLWSRLGVELPGAIWTFSAWIEMALGGFLFKLGRVDNVEEPDVAREPLD